MKMTRKQLAEHDVRALRLMRRIGLNRFERRFAWRLLRSDRVKARGLSDYQRAWCMAIVSRKITTLLKKIKQEKC